LKEGPAMPLLPLLTLTLATFVIGSSELMIQGLLPEVAQGLGVAIPAAGLLITAYALGVTLGSPLVTLMTIRMRRKAALLTLMGIFAAGQALCALAPDYGVLLTGRIAASLCHGAFVAIASVVAVGIAPENRRAAAVSLVWSGFAASNVLGVPAGTALGQAFGWRSTFWTVAAIAAVSLAAMAALLPDAGKADDPRVSHEFRALARPEVVLTLMLAALLLASVHSVFTFITPLLEETAGAVPSAIPGYLFAFGVGGVIGMQVGGRFADRNVLKTLIAICAANVAVSLVLLAAFRAPAPALAMMFVWGFALYFTAAPVQLRIVDTAREAPNLASTLLQSGMNAGIAAGPFLGAAGLRAGMTYAELPLIASGLALAALATAVSSAALERCPSATPGGQSEHASGGAG
jgi:MFS transporter, DHA1 family, inner membrane transport protein